MPETKLITLRRLAGAGGPAVKTMLWRIRNGKYPNAVKQAGHWCLTGDDAVKVLAEWMDRKEGVSIADVAQMCGLKKTSLNAKAIAGKVKAIRVMTRWFVAPDEVSRLQDYYRGTVSTSEAARRLGYMHRRSIHDLMARGLAHVRIGVEYRIRVSDIEDLLSLRAQQRRLP